MPVEISHLRKGSRLQIRPILQILGGRG
jgi:hypothetical protein